MRDVKLIGLVEKLDQRSADGTLNWEKTVSDSEFQANLTRFVIRIREIYNGATEPDYTIALVNLEGTELESFTDFELTKLMNIPLGAFGGENGFVKMQRIYNCAKRKAFGVDEAIDEIMIELDGSMPPGEI